MEQNKRQKQSQEQLSFSEQLRKSIINQPCNSADLWGRAADSFPQISANNVFAPLLQSWSVSLSAALAMHFLSSPERWIRL